jgi:hypothetical protein
MKTYSQFLEQTSSVLDRQLAAREKQRKDLEDRALKAKQEREERAAQLEQERVDRENERKEREDEQRLRRLEAGG